MIKKRPIKKWDQNLKPNKIKPNSQGHDKNNNNENYKKK